MSLAMLDSVRIGKLRRCAPLCRRERKYARCHGIEALERREMMAADVVIDWNNHTLAAIRATNTAPPIASRALAIVHTAIYDAVNAIDRAYQPYAVDVVALPDSSREAAVAAAAQRALSSLFPSQSSAFTTALTASLAAIPDGEAEDHGVALGLSVADRILALRANDGSATAVNYTPVGGIGQWRPTPPANAPALLPQWANVAPWAMKSPSQFDPQGIPALTSAAYAAAVNEVKNYGAATGSLRTEDQTAIAKFWANGVGTSTPPGHLNVMAQVVAENENNSVSQNARMFAILNVALADAAIMAWNTKFSTDFWRPITAIRNADLDGNATTSADANWTPLLVTPPFPTYVSGHSSFSGAAAAALKAFYGRDNFNFTVPSEDPTVGARSFTSFSQAAGESAVSRLYGGIHFNFDNNDGLSAGQAIGLYVGANFFLPQARKAAAGLVGNTLVIVGSEKLDAITVLKQGAQVIVHGVSGANRFALSAFSAISIDARGGNDYITVDTRLSTPAAVFGGTGNVFIFGGGGNDNLDGGAGNDYLYGRSGADVLNGGIGNDWLFGGNGDDVLRGGDGRDWLYGELGRDTLDGGAGDDWLFGGLGLDTLIGGTGKNRQYQ